jgi:hypothetical protein
MQHVHCSGWGLLQKQHVVHVCGSIMLRLYLSFKLHMFYARSQLAAFMALMLSVGLANTHIELQRHSSAQKRAALQCHTTQWHAYGCKGVLSALPCGVNSTTTRPWRRRHAANLLCY